MAQVYSWLLGEPRFVSRYRQLVLRSVAQEFPSVELEATSQSFDWQYLIFCASVLARSHEAVHQDAALRIAQSCLTDASSTREHRRAAMILLDRLWNEPAVRLAMRRHLAARPSLRDLPMTLGLAALRREGEASLELADGTSIRLNGFQREFWHAVTEHQWVSVSAPTSAGKSYIIKRWIQEELAASERLDIVYVAPTRALVQEVERDLREHLLDDDVEVCTVPSIARVLNSQRRVFVMTQERYQIMMSMDGEPVTPSILIVDEAHKVGDGARGALLQHVVDETVRRHPKARVVFASPHTSNPDALLAPAPPTATKRSLVREDITVNQNLIWVSQVPRRPTRWKLELIVDEEKLDLGTVDLPAAPGTVQKKLAYVSFALGKDRGGNIVYVNGPAEAEEVAALLARLLGTEPGHQHELDELADLARVAVHERYSLARVVGSGVAFHYGNMPLLLRSEIERLFSAGALKFLVCTSTLIEGVNLACRTIFARGPRRGKGQPMRLEDFWNLAGRAGRWGTEFQGNIVCLEPREAVWKKGVPRTRQPFDIETTVDRMRKRSQDLVRYAADEFERPEGGDYRELEALFSYGYVLTRRGRLDLSQLLDSDAAALIEENFHALDEAGIPLEIAERNPGIDVRGMARLLRYFEGSDNDLEELVPVAAASDDALDTYVRIFGRINKHLSPGVFGPNPRVYGCALLTVNWMRGDSLPRLIDKWVNRRNAPRPVAWPSEIRRVMSDVEEIARFQAPRLITCYVDVLRHFAAGIRGPHQADAIDLIPDRLGEFLEFGVSAKTQLSLVALGLSRSTVVALYAEMVDDQMDVADCLDWLRTHPPAELKLSTLVRREVEHVLARHQAR